MTAYYNEVDPYAAQWLRNLIDAGHIAAGVVDDRSISDIRPTDLVGFTQCHFFAGIGGWSLALRLAGWSDDRRVWTGSCPCQPFSVAGAGRGVADERHLWPHWFHLVRELRPLVIFGEQVEAAIAHGWLDLVQDDMEGEGYSCAAIDLGAASVGAPYIRQRLYWVADASGTGLPIERVYAGVPCGAGEAGTRQAAEREGALGVCCERRAGAYAVTCDCPWNPWRVIKRIECSDGKARPTQPGIFPLAHGVSGRVGRLRAYGNAIVPQVAAEVIRAYMECRPC